MTFLSDAPLGPAPFLDLSQLETVGISPFSGHIPLNLDYGGIRIALGRQAPGFNGVLQVHVICR